MEAKQGEHHETDKPQYHSESSVMAHPNKRPPEKLQLHASTWLLIIVLIGAFFRLKYFIYLKDEKRHGK